MVPRAYWKGYLKLSLVTCPVAMYPASSQSEKTRFHQINRKTGNGLRQQMVDEKTGRAIKGDNKGRVYEHKRGSYVEIEPEELEAVEVESARAIDIDKIWCLNKSMRQPIREVRSRLASFANDPPAFWIPLLTIDAQFGQATSLNDEGGHYVGRRKKHCSAVQKDGEGQSLPLRMAS